MEPRGEFTIVITGAQTQKSGPSDAEFGSNGYQEWEEGMEGDGWTSGTFETTVTFSEPGFELFGPTAVTNGRVLIEHPEGPVDQRIVRVFSKRDERWQAVAVYVFPLGENQ